MISDFLIPKLQVHFPNRGLRTGTPPNTCAVFPAVHPEVGDVVIQDDGDEVTLYAGNFTHSHFSNYDENLSREQKAERIAEDVVEFLEDLFADQVILWGSHRDGGGCRARELSETSESHLSKGREKKYVWSGPLNG